MKFTSPSKVNPGFEGDLKDPMEYPNEKKDLAMVEEVSVKKNESRKRSLRVVIGVALGVAIAASIGLVALLVMEYSPLFKKHDLRAEDFRISITRTEVYDMIVLRCEVDGRQDDFDDLSISIYQPDHQEAQLYDVGSGLFILRDKQNEGRYYCVMRYKNKWEQFSDAEEIKFEPEFNVTLNVVYQKTGAELQCYADGDTDERMTYVYNFPDNYRKEYGSNSIFLSKGSQNEGTYTCEAHRDGVVKTSKARTVIFNQIRPTVTGMPSSAPLLADVHLECNLGKLKETSVPYIWTIGDKYFAVWTKTMTLSMSNGHFNQEVTCTAILDDRIVKSDPVNTPAKPEEADISIFARYTPYSDQFRLSCLINGKEHRKDNHILYTFYHSKHPNKHREMLFNALGMVQVKENEDTYSCKVNYRELEWQKQSNQLVVKFDKTPPEVKGMPQTASLNSKITLRCENRYHTNQLVRSYTWQIGNRTLNSTKSTAEFTMEMDDYDQNVYCTAVYQYMSITSFPVKTPAEPTNEVDMHITYFPIKWFAMLECWVNGKRVEKSGLEYKINKADGTSTRYTSINKPWMFTNSSSNKGVVSCTTKRNNGWKHTSQTVGLTFDFELPVVRNMVSSARTNDKITLICDNSASKDQTDTFSWTFANKTLASTSRSLDLTLDENAFDMWVGCTARYRYYDVISSWVKTPARPSN